MNFNNFYKLGAIILLLSISKSHVFCQSLSQFVNPFIGTGGHGHTFPGATLPFGMVQLSPDTRLDGWDGCSGYHYSDSILYGFSHTHLSGTGCSDYGDILLMPSNKNIVPKAYNFSSSFNKKTEKASPGYYEVTLNNGNIKVQLSATLRTGIHQYTFQKNDEQFMVLDLLHRDEVLDSELEIVYPNKVKGYRYSKAWATNQKIYFEIEFSKPFKAVTFYSNDSAKKNPYVRSKNIKAFFAFNNSDQQLQVKVAISAVDENGAYKNLEKEATHFDFEKYKHAAVKVWDAELDKIKMTTSNLETLDEKIIFYTALYHCFIQPNIYNDVDNRYRGRDDKIHSTNGKFNYYTVFSIWDTYRAWHPLMCLLDEKRVNDFIETFIAQYQHSGLLPIWELGANETNCMIGNHAASVIWDAYSKNIKSYDIAKAYEAMKTMANRNIASLNSYKKFGFVRADDDAEGVSKTLEYAYDDWCLAQFGIAIMKNNQAQLKPLKQQIDSLQKIVNSWDGKLDSSIAMQLNVRVNKFQKDSIANSKIVDEINLYLTRANCWQNVYDPTTGFMRAQHNGTLYKPFSPYTVDNNYTEANSWQYSFYVPHQINKLIDLHGGKDKFEQKLDDLFTAKPQTEGRQQADITGLIGQYAHGNEPSHHIAYLYNYTNHPQKTTSMVEKICKEMYQNAPDGLSGNEDCGQMSAWYVMSKIGYYPICPGSGVYEYNKNLAKNWTIQGNAKKHHPENFIVSENQSVYNTSILQTNLLSSSSFIANPFIINASQIFKDSQIISMQCSEQDAFIFYTINKDKPSLYVAPFKIYGNTTIDFFSAKDDRKSPMQQAIFKQLPTDRSIQIKSIYNKSYSAGGPEALIDGLWGDENWHKGYWQGYQSQDFEATISFKTDKNIQSIKAYFLQDQRSWIFFPTNVSFYGSTDNINFEKLYSTDLNVVRDDEKNSLKTISFSNSSSNNKRFKYIKVVAKNYGILPSWHPGAGGDAFIFIDEIEVE